MAHRRTPRIYAPRRVPQSFSPAYTAMRLIPLVPALLASGALGLVSELPALSEEMRQKARHASQSMGDDSSERSQRLFFDEPGLDTLFVRFLAGSAQAVSHVAKTVMRARIALEPDSPMGKRAAQALPLVPKRAYDTLMTGMLSIGTAVGYIHSGPVHAQVIADSAEASSIDPPAGHATAALRRWEAPQSLGGLCADIDDMYWSMTDGHTVKITRVGEGEARRWLVSLPGTAHMDFESNANPADMESNIREMIGIESNMRSGLVMAIHDAMKRDGLNSEEYAMEPVLICGHSQGGLVATVLASTCKQSWRREHRRAGIGFVRTSLWCRWLTTRTLSRRWMELRRVRPITESRSVVSWCGRAASLSITLIRRQRTPKQRVSWSAW